MGPSIIDGSIPSASRLFNCYSILLIVVQCPIRFARLTWVAADLMEPPFALFPSSKRLRSAKRQIEYTPGPLSCITYNGMGLSRFFCIWSPENCSVQQHGHCHVVLELQNNRKINSFHFLRFPDSDMALS